MKMRLQPRAIDKVYKRRDRIEMPDFQREEVWSIDKKRLLIDSILRGYRLPKFYFRKLDNQTFECVDGQQRLSAIFDFYENRLGLNPVTAARVGGQLYSELPDNISDEFDDYEIDIEEIQDSTDEELEELFQRLQFGTPLNTAEKLNATSGGLRNFCHSVANSRFFDEKIALRDPRYAHFEIVTMWALIEARGILPQMRLPQLQAFLTENRQFSTASEIAKRLRAAVEFLDQAFPERSQYLRNRANVLTACMLAGRVIDQGLNTHSSAKTFGRFVERFFMQLATEVEKGVRATDKELVRYQQAITSGSTGGDSIRTRIEILTKRLATDEAEFAPLLGAYRAASDEAARSISELANECRDAVYSTNRQYSADHGEDLFKMTTESSAALSTLAIPCRDQRQYGDLVDALYMLVYEGSGSCARLPSPPPDFAMDVKFLRTALRHDVDHGDQKDIAKKKVRSGDVFAKYSGKRTAEECGPEDFIRTQVRILEGMLAFLGLLP